jgi:hypothetical protein
MCGAVSGSTVGLVGFRGTRRFPVLRKVRPRLSYANVTATLALATALAGTAVASIPGPDGTIKGCYKKSNGSLRVIDSAKRCNGGEKALTWNKQGPSGLTEALSGHRDTAVTVQGSYADIAWIDVPAGSYVVTATAALENQRPDAGAYINCFLHGGGTGDSRWTALQPQQSGNAYSQGIALSDVISDWVDGGRITLTCGTSNPVKVSSVRITALLLNHVTDTMAGSPPA